MIFMFAVVLFLVLLTLPFVPGLGVYGNKADSLPLFINMDYRHNPFYFAASFKKLLKEAADGCGLDDGTRSLKLSKQELVDIVDSASIEDGRVINNVCYVKNNLVSAAGVVFEKEVYVQGRATVGANNHIRAMVGDGDIYLGRGARITRWLNSEGGIRASEDCDLGVSATCGRELFLARNCLFKRLYGFPVTTGAASGPFGEAYRPRAQEQAALEAAAGLADGLAAPAADVQIGGGVERNPAPVAACSRKECTLISERSLEIGDYALVSGHVKTHGELVVGTGVTIAGNLFAEGDISLGSGSRILGSIFTQGRVVCGPGVTVGGPGRLKSVVGKKGVILQTGTRIYGYVTTEGEGIVV